MTSRPRVSVVVPAFNRERYLGLTIESVLAQTFRDWELIVSDDGSVDGTADVARRLAADDERIRVVSHENAGVAQARNRGLAASNGASEYVVFLDSDDIWEPDALETLVAALDADPASASVHGMAQSTDADGHQPPDDDLAASMRSRTAYVDGRRVPLPHDAPTPFTALVHHNWVVTPGTQLIRRTALETVGGFDTVCDPADDWDMAIRLSRLSDIRFVDRPVLWWRRHGTTLSSTSKRWRLAGHRVRRKMLSDPSNTPAQARAARWACRDEARGHWRGVRDALTGGRPIGALRNALKAIDSSVRFRWTVATSRLTRRADLHE